MNPNQPPVSSPPKPGADGEQLKQVKRCTDGKYRWIYELDMLKNPSILFLLFKIFGGIIAGIGGFIALLGLFEGEGLQALLHAVQIIIIMSAIFFFLILVGYLLVAAMYRGKYVVMFEMDHEGILHRQMNQQVKQAKALGWLTALAGAATGSATAAGSGILAATKTASYSTCSAVKSVKAYPRRHLIKVNEPFCKNQVYVDDDFDFVYSFILSHCPKIS